MGGHNAAVSIAFRRDATSSRLLPIAWRIACHLDTLKVIASSIARKIQWSALSHVMNALVRAPSVIGSALHLVNTSVTDGCHRVLSRITVGGGISRWWYECNLLPLASSMMTLVTFNQRFCHCTSF